jgi:hypothetical protein
MPRKNPKGFRLMPIQWASRDGLSQCLNVKLRRLKTMSNYKQFMQDLKKADGVFGYLPLTEHDGMYVKLIKSDIRKFVREGDEIKYHVTDNSVYIN